MNNDPKYWEEVVLPWVQNLRAKQKEALRLTERLERIAKQKAFPARVVRVCDGYALDALRNIELKTK